MSTITRENTDEKWTDEKHSFDADDRVAHPRNETAEDLAALNPIGFGADGLSCEMIASRTAMERGFTRLPYDGTDPGDVEFERTTSLDGGFLGRAHGWER